MSEGEYDWCEEFAATPDGPLCEECGAGLEAERMLGRTCLSCADTQEIPQVEAK